MKLGRSLQPLAFLALGGALSCVEQPAHAQASQQTLADAVAMAFDQNPTVLANRNARAQADENLEQARAARRPTAGITSSYTALESRTNNAFQYGIFTSAGKTVDVNIDRSIIGLQLNQTLYAGGSLDARQKQAQAGVEAAQGRLSSQEQQLVLDVVTAFVDVRRADDEIAIRNQTVDSLKQQVRAARDRFNVGEVTRTDVAQAEARLAGAEAALADAQARAEAAKATYAQLVGVPPLQLAAPPPPPPIPASLDAAVAAAAAANPLLQSRRANDQAAREAVRAEQGAWLPRLSLSGQTGITDTRNDASFRDTNSSITAQLSIPLYQGGLVASRTRQSRLAAEQSHLETLAAEREVRARTTSAWYAVKSARQSIESSRIRVAAAEVALEGAKQELSVGTRITLDVLDQETELVNARLGLVDAQRAEYVAVHQLQALTGALTPRLLGR